MEKYGRQYGVCASHAGYLKLQVHTPKLCNIHCFSPATMVSRKRLSITLYLLYIACLVI